ncbi:hypothetical protein [Chlorogloeopsis fritschii]|uniref:hypothetical protein n=1 Tax=Chlorogloeopsis fritschii TaxID=1124 RepID=UPI0023F14B7A|nr:hypothetical protein [Chlorogloeopsis fritschii]
MATDITEIIDPVTENIVTESIIQGIIGYIVQAITQDIVLDIVPEITQVIESFTPTITVFAIISAHRGDDLFSFLETCDRPQHS